MSKKNTLNVSVDELCSELEDCQEALQNLVFQKSLQQLEDLTKIKKMKRKIARLNTLIHEHTVLNNS